MPYPVSLSSLSPREAVIDALYRAIIGFERKDDQMLKSSFDGEDVTMEIFDGEKKSLSGLSTIRAQVLDGVALMDTTHMISNVRVDVKDGANTASLTAYALAQHCPPGRGKEPDGPKYLVGGEYSIDLIKDEKDQLWKIKKWALDVIWRQGDRSVMQRETN